MSSEQTHPHEFDPALRPIAVIGPTASGKSALGLDLAEKFNGEVVNVDSMQLYRRMDIGTAKLPVKQRRGIPHHQLDVLDIHDRASVAKYQQEAVADVEAIIARGHVPILVGGSMLYVQALVDDWQFPPTDPQVREKWSRRQEAEGMAAMYELLCDVDPAAAAIIEPQDPRRIIRALEVIELTGKPYAASKPDMNSAPRWNTTILGLATTTQWLNPRIERRTHLMFEQGFVAEVQGLEEQGLRETITAARAIGYAQVLAYLGGEYDYDTAVDRTITGTRKYVRRQKSWFHKDPRVQWLDATAGEESVWREAQEALADRKLRK